MNRGSFLLAVMVVLAGGCASSSKRSATPPATCACAKGGKTKVTVASDEPALMDQVRAQLASAPAAALALTDEGESRFGDSALAEERRALAIQALINLGQIGAARSRAYKFLERYPTGPYSDHVASMTGVHVTPRGPGEQKPSP
jgi:hypothetical protein